MISTIERSFPRRLGLFSGLFAVFIGGLSHASTVDRMLKVLDEACFPALLDQRDEALAMRKLSESERRAYQVRLMGRLPTQKFDVFEFKVGYEEVYAESAFEDACYLLVFEALESDFSTSWNNWVAETCTVAVGRQLATSDAAYNEASKLVRLANGALVLVTFDAFTNSNASPPDSEMVARIAATLVSESDAEHFDAINAENGGDDCRLN